jgi:DNA helicase-2/ATP-dependent DNA helicase PcrA
VAALLNAVAKLSQSGSITTIAIIGRTAKEAQELHAALAESGLTTTLIVAGQQEYEGGISVLPVYLAKGLEFDAVLLVDVDAYHYEQSFQDAKLLYVGCTRALHELWLFYTGKPSPLIDQIEGEFIEAKRWR